MDWRLPPELPWPQFLRLLRHPAPPKGWLEAAAALEDVQRRPMLLRWIAQHRQTPAHLRMRLLPRLPWRALAAIAADGAAHPQARAWCVERLQALWTGLSLGERRGFAMLAPRPLWPAIWRVRDAGVTAAFLQHPKLGLEALLGLLQPPLLPTHLDALLRSRWAGLHPVALQVLDAMDRSFHLPEHGLVLGQAAPWIKVLTPEARILAASRMQHPPLRLLTRAWGGHPVEALQEGPDAG